MSNTLGFTIDVQGAEEMKRTFDKSPDFFDNVFSDVLSSLASQFVGKAKGYAPVKTGSLRASIHKDGVTGSGKNLSITVGTDILYAPFQEFGTRYIAARRFFQRAREDIKGNAEAQMSKAASTLIRDLAK